MRGLSANEPTASWHSMGVSAMSYRPWPWRPVAFLLMVLVLAGCTSGPARNDGNWNPNAGRYSLENDVPDLESFDVATVEPVVPRAETRTIAGNKSPYTINGRTYYVRDTEAGYVANGYASWYGRKFHGHQTSNGETYDMFKLTAAHKTLPIPSYVRVTNLENERSVIVRINDRGPFHDDRIIDLSYAAATLLGYAAQGTARVKVEAILPAQDAPTTPVLVNNETTAPVAPPTFSPPVLTVAALPVDEAMPSSTDYLQVGAFASEDSARSLVERLADITSLPALIHSETQSGTGQLLHRVRLGPIDPGLDVERLIRLIRDANLGSPFRVSQ